MVYKVTYVSRDDYDRRFTDTVEGRNYTDAVINAEMAFGKDHILTEVKLHWGSLYFGKIKQSEIREAIRDAQWQQVRLSMKGMSTEDKYKTLEAYLAFKKDMLVNEHEMRMVHVRVTNYVTALSRGGIIKPEDYR